MIIIYLEYLIFLNKIYWYVSDGNYFASTGIYYRLLINLIPAIILIIFYKRFDSNKNEKIIFSIFFMLYLVFL